jgi:hypothetical protein
MMYCTIILPLFLQYLTHRENLSVVDLLHQNPYWCSPIISTAYGISIERRMLDKILYEADSNEMP